MLPPPAPPTVRDRLVRLRLMLVALSVCLWGVVMIVRLVQLQVLGRESFERQAARQSERTINLDPRRGPILDRNGRPLAVSVDAESIYAVPQEIHEPDRTAAALSRIDEDWSSTTEARAAFENLKSALEDEDADVRHFVGSLLSGIDAAAQTPRLP